MKKTSDPAPNILFINTDQQRGDCLSCEGHPVLLTPTMDAIAARGVRFSHFYSSCPSCIAARRTMLTGQDPQTHGFVGYHDGVEWDMARSPTLPQVLREHGYQTALIGRAHHQSPACKRYGYDEMKTRFTGGHQEGGQDSYFDWLRLVGPKDNSGWFGGGVMHNDWTARPWHMDEHLHFTNWTVTETLRFLERRDTSCPFFLTVQFIAPHPPLQPPAFYMDRYLRTGVPEPVIGDWAEPAAFGEEWDWVAPNRVNLTGEAMRSTRAAYYGSINHVDDQLRRLLNGITGVDSKTGGNTIVVFTSDHGEMLGDHYFWRKSRAYEASARVPFLVSAPGRFGVKRTHVVDAVATHADIMPTLLDMAGIPIPKTVDGRSLWPVMRGEKPARWRPFVHIEHAPWHHGLTDGLEKYIWWTDTGREQFFDLREDPTECHDLIHDGECRARIARWHERMIQRLTGRPEGFVKQGRLVAGRKYDAIMPGTNGH